MPSNSQGSTVQEQQHLPMDDGSVVISTRPVDEPARSPQSPEIDELIENVNNGFVPIARHASLENNYPHSSPVDVGAGIAPDDSDDGWEDESDRGGPEHEDDEFVSVDHDDITDLSLYFRRPPVKKTPSPLDDLHPFTEVLTAGDLEDCVQVEAAFPEQERCSKDKLQYRLTACPELALGFFSIPPKSMWPNGQKPRPTLLAHIIGTKTWTKYVTDASMDYPRDWRENLSTNGSPIGHDGLGSTVAVHSLAVLPEHQHKGLGSTLMKAYIERIKTSGMADRVSILTHDELIPFYERLGFKPEGPSACHYAGGNWFDMIYEFRDADDFDDDE